ncbi:NAD(P)-binding domain-containing protein, partial [Mesorhizobium sp. BR1-1-5]|nr:NAD(P)-binding domain-containing protein [Mesorhizobium sp. BR1-1-5]
MSDPRTVAVLGAGSWGSAFARVLGLSTSPESARASEIVMWSRRAEVAEAITERHENPEYLPGITLPTCVRAVTDAAEAVRGAGVVVVAVPAQHVRETLRTVRADLAPDAVVVSLVKGLERGTDARMSQVCAEELGLSPDRFAVVSGPNLALEIARGEPTAT